MKADVHGRARRGLFFKIIHTAFFFLFQLVNVLLKKPIVAIDRWFRVFRVEIEIKRTLKARMKK